MGVAASAVIDFAAQYGTAIKVVISPSQIEVGDNVQIDIFAPEKYTLISPYNNATRLPATGAQEFEEDIDINNSATVTTNFPVAELISAVYLTPMINTKDQSIIATAGQTANVDIINSVVSLDGSESVGTIRVKYKTYPAQSYKLTAFTKAGSHVVFYQKDGDSEKTPFIFSVGTGQPDEKSQPSIVTAQSKDFCTDLPVEGTSVYINNTFLGQTDINGKLVVGLMAGGPHTIKMVATGYIPTDADDLQNDSFQI